MPQPVRNSRNRERFIVEEPFASPNATMRKRETAPNVRKEETLHNRYNREEKKFEFKKNLRNISQGTDIC